MQRQRYPFRPHSITLRVCADFGWQVIVNCPRCRYGVMLNLDKLASKPMGAVALSKLLGDGAFRCRSERYGKTCEGQPASQIQVSYMDVGHLRTLGVWTLTETGVRLSEPD